MAEQRSYYCLTHGLAMQGSLEVKLHMGVPFPGGGPGPPVPVPVAGGTHVVVAGFQMWGTNVG
ncbi:MAG: hypothetical protein ACREN5_07370 [Gemmatimonadales bacterium]